MRSSALTQLLRVSRVSSTLPYGSRVGRRRQQERSEGGGNGGEPQRLQAVHLETTEPTPSSVSSPVNTTMVNASAPLAPNTNTSLVSPFLSGQTVHVLSFMVGSQDRVGKSVPGARSF